MQISTLRGGGAPRGGGGGGGGADGGGPGAGAWVGSSGYSGTAIMPRGAKDGGAGGSGSGCETWGSGVRSRASATGAPAGGCEADALPSGEVGGVGEGPWEGEDGVPWATWSLGVRRRRRPSTVITASASAMVLTRPILRGRAAPTVCSWSSLRDSGRNQLAVRTRTIHALAAGASRFVAI